MQNDLKIQKICKNGPLDPNGKLWLLPLVWELKKQKENLENKKRPFQLLPENGRSAKQTDEPLVDP